MQSPLAFVCVVLLPIATLSCTDRHVRHWHELAVGMDKPTVRRLLGTPTTEMGPVTRAATRPSDLFMLTLFYGEVFDRQGWVYHRPGLLSGLDNLFGPAVDAHVVYFDASGRVQGWREPLTKDDPRPGATRRAFWRRYRELVVAADGAAEFVEEPLPDLALDEASPVPAPMRGTADAESRCEFQWDAPPGAPPGARYWVQIGVGEGKSATTAPVHEWPQLTIETPRTAMHLEFGMRVKEELLAYWRVRIVNVETSTAGEWSPW